MDGMPCWLAVCPCCGPSQLLLPCCALQACAPGMYTDKTGSSACQPCNPGRYANETGSLSCKVTRLLPVQAAPHSRLLCPPACTSRGVWLPLGSRDAPCRRHAGRFPAALPSQLLRQHGWPNCPPGKGAHMHTLWHRRCSQLQCRSLAQAQHTRCAACPAVACSHARRAPAPLCLAPRSARRLWW